jgi:hypothetical protein
LGVLEQRVDVLEQRVDVLERCTSTRHSSTSTRHSSTSTHRCNLVCNNSVQYTNPVHMDEAHQFCHICNKSKCCLTTVLYNNNYCTA